MGPRHWSHLETRIAAMEFFKIIERKTTEKQIQESLTLSTLDKMTHLLFIIGDQNERQAEIGGLWGEFTLTRSEIKGGLFAQQSSTFYRFDINYLST